jgi:hypothetical protein
MMDDAKGDLRPLSNVHGGWKATHANAER